MRKSKSIKGYYQELNYLQKKGSGTPFYTRFINRKIGQIFASIFAYWNLSPNMISILSGAITIGAYISFLLIPDIRINQALVLYLILIVGYAFDSSDGLVARVLNKQSSLGEWIDHSIDAFKIPFGHGVLLALILNNNEISSVTLLFLLIILAFASCQFLANILKSKLYQLSDYTSAATHKNSNPGYPIIKSLLLLPVDYGTFMVIFLFTPYPKLLLQIYLLWGTVYVIATFIGLLKSAVGLSKL